MTLSAWRDEFLEGSQPTLKRGSQDPKAEALGCEKKQLQAKVGELLMDKELLEMRIARFEGEAPFGKRRLRP